MLTPVEFYNLVNTAREHCGGSAMRNVHVVMGEVRRALDYGQRNAVCKEYTSVLTQVLNILEKEITLADRIKADELLCDVLNKILKEN